MTETWNSKKHSIHNASSQETRYFLLKTGCSKKWKQLVFNAVICSKLFYGLETLEPTQRAGRLLDTFQLKGLRTVLKRNTTFIQRRNCNEYVFRRANEILGGQAERRMRKIRPLTEVLQERKLKLLRHILRRERQHPLHQAAFATRSATSRGTDHHRVGRPRQFWTVKTMERAWDIIKNQDQSQPQIPFDKNDRRMKERIIAQSQNYETPFQRGWVANFRSFPLHSKNMKYHLFALTPSLQFYCS